MLRGRGLGTDRLKGVHGAYFSWLSFKLIKFDLFSQAAEFDLEVANHLQELMIQGYI